MTLLTGVGGRVDPEADELYAVLAANDSEIEAAGRIVETLERELRRVRQFGVSEDVVVAVESVAPGTLDKKVKTMVTRNASRTNQERTIVALENALPGGKFALIAALVGGIIVVLKWLIDNSGAGGGKNEAVSDPAAEKDKVAETAAKYDEIEDLAKVGNLPEIYKEALVTLYQKIEKNEKFDVARANKVLSSLGGLKTTKAVLDYFESRRVNYRHNALVSLLEAGYKDINDLPQGIAKAFTPLLRAVVYKKPAGIDGSALGPYFKSGRLRLVSDQSVKRVDEALEALKEVVADTKKTLSSGEGVASITMKTANIYDKFKEDIISDIYADHIDSSTPDLVAINGQLPQLASAGVVSPKAFSAAPAVFDELQTSEQIDVVEKLLALAPGGSVWPHYGDMRADRFKSLLKEAEGLQSELSKVNENKELFDKLQAKVTGTEVTGNVAVKDVLAFVRLSLVALTGVVTSIRGHNRVHPKKK